MHACNHDHHKQQSPYIKLKRNPVGFRQGRIRKITEFRRQLYARTRLERRMYKQLDIAVRRWLNNITVIYQQTGFFDPTIATFQLDQEIRPVLQDNIKRIYRVMFGLAEERFELAQKGYATRYEDRSESFIFGRNADIDTFVIQYFGTRDLILAGISQRLSLRIYKAINDVILNGGSMRDAANAIRSVGYPLARHRVALIARTETHNAASIASNEYYLNAQDTYGLQMKKIWQASLDSRTREAHARTHDQEQNMNDPFNVDGALMMYAGDSAGGAKNVVNCRCVILYSDKEDDFF